MVVFLVKFVGVSMKKVLLIICLFFSLCSSSYSTENYFVVSFENRFQKVEGTINGYKFIPLSKEEYKKLDKFEKLIYNDMKKSYKYWNKALLAKSTNDVIKYSKKSLKYYPLYPVYYNLIGLYDHHKDYKNALFYTQELLKQGYNVSDDIHFGYAKFNWALRNYAETISGAEKYLKLNTKDSISINFCYFILADSNWELSNYEKAIYYANKSLALNKNFEKRLTEIKYSAYLSLKNIIEANKLAHKLYSWSYPDKYTSAIRLAFTSSSDADKLKYYKIAKDNTTDEKKIVDIDFMINTIYERKLDNECKKYKGYINRPKWLDFALNDPMTPKQGIERFENYCNRLDRCFKFNGTDFKNCLADLKNDEEKISQRLQSEHQERQRQLIEQERIRQMQIMNANLIQSNYLQQQQNYILNRPRYQNSTTTRYGNTYYTNSYSY